MEEYQLKKIFIGIFMGLLTFNGCKVAGTEENAQEASVRFSTAGGWILGVGHTHQVFFHAIDDNNICVYGVNAKNNTKNAKSESVGKMKQVDLFKGFAEPFPKGSTYAIDWSGLSSQVKSDLTTLEKVAKNLYSAKEEPCQRVAMNRAAARGGECGGLFRGISDATVCNTPRSLGAGGRATPLPGWAVCEQRTKRMDCPLSQYNLLCRPCLGGEICLEGQGKMDQAYSECVYSEARDPDASSCSSGSSAYRDAQETFSFQNKAFELINSEVERVVNQGKVATDNDIRNINEEMLLEIKKTVSKHYTGFKTSKVCPAPAEIPL